MICFGSARSAESAVVSKESRSCGALPLNGRSDTKLYFTDPSRALMRFPSSIDSVAGIGIAAVDIAVIVGRP